MVQLEFSDEGDNMRNNMSQVKPKVFVGLSGGVDSSVSAALLKKAGFDVVGVFIKVWQPDWMECSAKDDRLDAMRVCAYLGIPFKEINLEKQYKQKVVDYMLDEYKAGRTPNPDIMCNSYVKFGAFYDWAIKNGAGYVATGHYARTGTRGFSITNFQFSKRKKFQLLTGIDTEKDQSYFLCQIKKEQLSKIIFPIGNYEKWEVRKLAKEFGLPTAEKKDSQGLCFIGKVDMKDFLSHYIKSKKGKVINENGQVLGNHDGATFYTEGQRHGFSIVSTDIDREPYYVVSKDVTKNTITVSGVEARNKLRGYLEIMIKNINILSRENLKKGSSVHVRMRYREELSKCKIIKFSKDEIVLKLPKSRTDIATGQFAVLYVKDQLVASGIISKLML